MSEKWSFLNPEEAAEWVDLDEQLCEALSAGSISIAQLEPDDVEHIAIHILTCHKTHHRFPD
jgi:hypothetical protein